MMHENIDLSDEESGNLPSFYDAPSTLEGCHEKFAHQFLQNMSSKRNLSEILEKSKHINRLKSSLNNLDKNRNNEPEGLSSDSGVSLNNSIENEESYSWIKVNNLSNSSDARVEWNNHTSGYNWSSTNISNSVEKLLNNSSYSSLTPSETNNDYGNIREFYAPQSSGNNDPLNKQTKDGISKMTSFQCSSIGKRLSPEKSREDIVYPGIRTSPKRVGRSADILARVQKSPSYTLDDERKNKTSDELEDSTNVDKKSISELNKELCINRRSYPGIYHKSNNFINDMRWRTKTSDIEKKTSADRTEKLPKEESALNVLKSEEKSLPKLKENKSTEQISRMAKSLIHIAHIKRSNKSVVADFLKTLGCSSTCAKHDLANNLTLITDDEENKKILPASGTKDNLVQKQSNESIKCLFPNSNRKREEKLRGNETAISDLNMMNNSECSPNKQIELKKNSKKTSNISTGKQKPINYPLNLMHHNKKKKIELKTVSPKDILKKCPLNQDEMSRKDNLQSAFKNDAMNSNKSFEAMETQSALIYLSDTLIESAQRAENLLMQKMKDYNDLVCRDPPEIKKQDFTCQALTLEQHAEYDFEKKLNVIGDQFKQELSKKNNKIKQLEIEQKKLRRIVKKLNAPREQRSQDENIRGKDSEKCIVTKVNLSDIERPKSNNEELIEALKLENNFLHTLLKEMKTELDQENETILSLAKKLEISLGQQTKNNSNQFEIDIVKQLGDKLLVLEEKKLNLRFNLINLFVQLEYQEKLLKQEAVEARTVAKCVIIKYKKLIQEYKQKVESYQETVDKLTNAIKKPDTSI